MNAFLEIYLGQILRHLLTIVATYLTVIGVTADQQNALVNGAVPVVLAAILFLIGQVWSAKSKKAAFRSTDNIFLDKP